MLRATRFCLYKHLILSAVTVFCLLPASIQPSYAKTPGKTYCFRGFCHRVLTLAETQQLIGKPVLQSTSNYDDCKRDRFNPCGLTSSGAVFQPDRADNAASPVFPDGTVILVRHPKTQKSAVLRVNSAGPYHQKRLLDVSRATAEVLGFKREGVANLEVKILKAPEKGEATYKHMRVYPPVPGYLGSFASLDQAGTHLAALSLTNTQVAAIYPQTQSSELPHLPPIVGNGIEKTWLAQAITFKPGKIEARRARRTAARLARLDHKKWRHARVG